MKLRADETVRFIAHSGTALRDKSGLRLGFSQAGDSITSIPLRAFLKQSDAVEAFKDIPFRAGGAGCTQASVL